MTIDNKALGTRFVEVKNGNVRRRGLSNGNFLIEWNKPKVIGECSKIVGWGWGHVQKLGNDEPHLDTSKVKWR